VTIEVDHVSDLVAVIAALRLEGIPFRAAGKAGGWTITIFR